MRRPLPTRLLLSSAELEHLVSATTPYDPRRLSASDFGPAQRYMRALGHLLRTEVDPAAWIREAAFELEIFGLEVAGPADELDEIVRLIGLVPERPEAGRPILFQYVDLNTNGLPAYRAEDLSFLDGGRLHALIEEDRAGLGVMDRHAGAIDASLHAFLAEHLDAHLFLAPRWEWRPLGVSYDRAKGDTGHKLPSPLEEPPSPPMRFLAPVIEAPERVAGSAEALDDAAAQALVAQLLSEGATGLRNFGVAGVIWPVVIIPARGDEALALRRGEAGWRVAGRLTIGDADRRFAKSWADRIERVGDL
jgi:hypothetical protein